MVANNYHAILYHTQLTYTHELFLHALYIQSYITYLDIHIISRHTLHSAS